MTFDISFQPMRVLIDGHDSEGSLVLVDNQLAAVFVRLDGPAPFVPASEAREPLECRRSVSRRCTAGENAR